MQFTHDGITIDLEFGSDGFPLINVDTGGSFHADNGRPAMEIQLNGVVIHHMFDEEDERWEQDASRPNDDVVLVGPGQPRVIARFSRNTPSECIRLSIGVKAEMPDVPGIVWTGAPNSFVLHSTSPARDFNKLMDAGYRVYSDFHSN